MSKKSGKKFKSKGKVKKYPQKNNKKSNFCVKKAVFYNMLKTMHFPFNNKYATNYREQLNTNLMCIGV